MNCKLCNSPGKILESRMAKDRRMRKYICEQGHKWDTVGEPGDRSKIRVSCNQRSLNPEQVKYILLSALSSRRIAAEMQISAGPVTKIRAGECYTDLFPEIDRSAIPSKILNKIVKKGTEINHRVCTDCALWDDRCNIGIPEQITTGIRYAYECGAFFAKPA
jgi:hypothetical protein